MQVFVWIYVFVSLGYIPRSEIVFLELSSPPLPWNSFSMVNHSMCHLTPPFESQSVKGGWIR